MSNTKNTTSTGFHFLRSTCEKPHLSAKLTGPEIFEERMNSIFIDPYAHHPSHEKALNRNLVPFFSSHVPCLSLNQWAWTLYRMSETIPSLEQLLKEATFTMCSELPEYFEIRMSQEENDAITNYNWMAVWLIARKFALDKKFTVKELRKTIGLLMHIPPEFVFSHDPDMSQSWAATQIEKTGETYEVSWAFLNEPMLSTSVTRKEDGTLAVKQDIPVLHRFSPYGKRFRKFMTGKSIAAVSDFIGGTVEKVA